MNSTDDIGNWTEADGILNPAHISTNLDDNALYSIESDNEAITYRAKKLLNAVMGWFA